MKALAGNIEAASNMDVILQSKEGLLVLDAETVRLPRLPKSEDGVSGNAQILYEVCVCPSGKLFLSKAGRTSTCSDNQDCQIESDKVIDFPSLRRGIFWEATSTTVFFFIFIPQWVYQDPSGTSRPVKIQMPAGINEMSSFSSIYDLLTIHPKRIGSHY